MSRLKALLVNGLEGDHRPLYSAAVALIQRHGHPTDLATVGHLSRYADADGSLLAPEILQPALESTIFDLASVTKLFTTTVLLTLVDEGAVRLDEPIAEWLPTFGDGERRRITLRHLLTHTSGLPALLRLWTDWPDHESRVQAVLRAPLVTRPGATFEYSCVGFMVAGLVAERITGHRLPNLVHDRICRPLGLTDTGYLPGPARAARAAATEYQPDIGRGMLRGSVHDENSWSLGATAGNAGLFGTAADIARFGEMLRQGGVLDGVRVLRPDTVDEMTRDHLPPAIDPGFRHGLGVRIGDEHWMGTLAAAGAFGHTGFTGTSLLVDPSRDLVVVLLTNRVHPSREWSDIAEIRRAVAELAADT
ncbi:serine hydrolase domain-containing protein [Micromonospora sp. LZ34]